MFKNDLVFGVHEKQVQVRDEVLCFVGEIVKCNVQRSVDSYICVHQCKQKWRLPSHRTLCFRQNLYSIYHFNIAGEMFIFHIKTQAVT